MRTVKESERIFPFAHGGPPPSRLSPVGFGQDVGYPNPYDGNPVPAAAPWYSGPGHRRRLGPHGFGQDLGGAAGATGTEDGTGSGDSNPSSDGTGSGGDIINPDPAGLPNPYDGGGGTSGGSTSGGGSSGGGGSSAASATGTSSISSNLPLIIGAVALVGGIGAVAYIAHRQTTAHASSRR